jgi:hypothetical protein
MAASRPVLCMSSRKLPAYFGSLLAVVVLIWPIRAMGTLICCLTYPKRQAHSCSGFPQSPFLGVVSQGFLGRYFRDRAIIRRRAHSFCLRYRVEGERR